MHHIFFPPRLEVVVLQQDANGLAAYSGNQLALNRFLRHHPYGPARIALRGIGANHRDDPLALTRLQQSCRTGPLLVVSVAAKKGAILALETGPLVRLRSGLR